MRPRNSSRRVHAFGAIVSAALLAWALACGGDGPTTAPGVARGLPGLVVSDPAPSIALSLRGSGGVSLATVTPTSGAYVSLAPGSVPDGIRARIAYPGEAPLLTVPMVDGGFDPVPVEAAEGDLLHLGIERPGALVELDRISVPRRRLPLVVRTDPPADKRDVALSKVVTIVFSEPIDPLTIGSSSVRLLLDGSEVPSRLEFTDADRVVLALTPQAPLQSSTRYQLVVTRDVHDVDGEPLEAAVTAEFETEALGTIHVLVTTSGPGVDSDGYAVLVDGGPDSIMMRDTTTIPRLRVGDHTVEIRSVCAVAPPNPATVRVNANQTSNVTFAVTCGAQLAAARVPPIAGESDRGRMAIASWRDATAMPRPP